MQYPPHPGNRPGKPQRNRPPGGTFGTTGNRKAVPRRERLAAASIAALAWFMFSACTVIGGVVGHAKDDRETRTRIVPVSEAATLRRGAMVYLTIQNRETLKGRFVSLIENGDRKSIEVKTPDGETRVGLADVSEIAEDLRNHDKLIKGLLIGGAVDVILAGSALWLYLEIQDRITPVY
jgi:hypothetical protein